MQASNTSFFSAQLGDNTSSVGSATVVRPAATAKRRKERVDEKIVSAVYAHLQAIKALGDTSANSMKIAQALDLPRSTVETALKNLRSRGVRLTK